MGIPTGNYWLYVNTGFANQRHLDVITVPDEFGLSVAQWNALSEEQQEELLNRASEEHMNNEIDYGWYPQEQS